VCVRLSRLYNSLHPHKRGQRGVDGRIWNGPCEHCHSSFSSSIHSSIPHSFLNLHSRLIMASLTAQPRFLRSITLDRAAKFSSPEFYHDINLYSRLYSKRTADTVELEVYSVPDLKRIPFDQAVQQPFEPASVGMSFGPSWVKNIPMILSMHFFSSCTTVGARTPFLMTTRL